MPANQAARFKDAVKTPARLNSNNQPIRPVTLEDKVGEDSTGLIEQAGASVDNITIGDTKVVSTDELDKTTDQSVEEEVSLGDTQVVGEAAKPKSTTKAKSTTKPKADANNQYSGVSQ